MWIWERSSNRKLPRTTMRISILSLFLSLILVSFSFTLIFLRYKNFQSLSQLSKQTIELTDRIILDKVTNLFNNTQSLVQSTGNLIHQASDISPENLWLRNYMRELIRYHPNIPYLFIGAKDGNYLEVANLAVSVQTHFLSDPSKPLPKGAVYSWQYFRRTDTSLEGMTFYYDEDFHQLASEDVSHSNYNPRERPWYLTGKEKDRFAWTPVYPFFDTGDPGITAVAALHSDTGEFLGVVGADLSFRFLSKFFAKQKIGQTGKPFIIDAKLNAIIIPDKLLMASSPISEETVAAAYQAFLHKKEHDFDFKSHDVRYLTRFSHFPIADEQWLIAIIVPFQDFFGDLERTQKEVFIILLLICFLSSLAISYFSKKLSHPIVSLAKAVDEIKQLELSSEDRIHSLIKEIDMMESSVYAMRLAFRSFIRYVPKEIVKELLSQNKEILLGGEKKEISVMFSDIADFTSIAEKLPTETLTSLLGEYFDGLSKIILKQKGTIDKYIGDSIMAFWGAPLEISNHTVMCAETALLCHHFSKELAAKWGKEGKPQFFTRFGINTGSVIVGNIGTPERMNYTLIGDTVNAASRLQNVNKTYATHILISDAVRQKLGPEFILRPLDIVEVKGKKEKITIYELIGKEGANPILVPSPQEKALIEKFTKAYQAFYANDRTLAKKLFEELHQEFPQDYPTELYLKRF